MHDYRGNATRGFHFATRFFLVVAGALAILLLFRVAFAFSGWAGFGLLSVLTIILYVTVDRWVRWLPGLLIFGVVNSLLGLITHQVPTNPHVVVSAGVAGLLLLFYAVGCVVTYHCDAAHLSGLDRCALLVYLYCMIWPTLVARKDLANVTSDIAWSVSIGVAVLIAQFATHRMRTKRDRRRKPNAADRHTWWIAS